MNNGDRLKFLLEYNNIKQVDFADILGITPARLNNYILDKTEADYNMLRKMITTLKTTSDYYFGLSHCFSSKQLNYKSCNYSFSERVKELLKYRNIKQNQLSEMLNITSARLNHYISEKIEAPYSLIINLSIILGTTTDYLLGLSDSAGSFLYNSNLHIKYGEMDNKTQKIYINIPVYKTGEAHPYRYEKCDAVLKNIYDLPFIIEAADDSMAPLINTGDTFLAAPVSYIKPVVNNLDMDMPYITFLSDNENALHIRYCLTKDDIIFLRPANLKYETKAYSQSMLEKPLVTGVIVKKYK